jgi:hypothetical protein
MTISIVPSTRPSDTLALVGYILKAEEPLSTAIYLVLVAIFTAHAQTKVSVWTSEYAGKTKV